MASDLFEAAMTLEEPTEDALNAIAQEKKAQREKENLLRREEEEELRRKQEEEKKKQDSEPVPEINFGMFGQNNGNK